MGPVGASEKGQAPSRPLLPSAHIPRCREVLIGDNAPQRSSAGVLANATNLTLGLVQDLNYAVAEVFEGGGACAAVLATNLAFVVADAVGAPMMSSSAATIYGGRLRTLLFKQQAALKTKVAGTRDQIVKYNPPSEEVPPPRSPPPPPPHHHQPTWQCAGISV